MKLPLNSTIFSKFLILVCPLFFCLPVQAEEADFSCMKQRVRAKTQVAQRYREYDVIVENQCPGDVYWSICIERMDPWKNKVLEVLSPSGQVLAEKKMRVNIQMMKVDAPANGEKRYEKFYVNTSFDLEPDVQAQCMAVQCEKEKRPLRKEMTANESAWQTARNQHEKKIEADCPKSGWGQADREACVNKANQAVQAEMNAFAQKNSELKEQLIAVNPQECEVHGGV